MRHGRIYPTRSATTQRVVNEAFTEEKPSLQPLPLVPFRAVLKLKRRVSHEGMVSVGGNLYSVPDATRKRLVEVHTLADEIRIFEADRLIAVHPVLEGRHQRSVAPGHCKMTVPARGIAGFEPVLLGRAGDVVARRPLDFCDAVARRLASEGGRPGGSSPDPSIGRIGFLTADYFAALASSHRSPILRPTHFESARRPLSLR